MLPRLWGDPALLLGESMEGRLPMSVLQQGLLIACILQAPWVVIPDKCRQRWRTARDNRLQMWVL